MTWFPLWLAAVASLMTSDEIRFGAVLSELDGVRAEAFASSDPAMLDDVYAPGSTGRADDASMIRAYASRDARVVGADLALLACKVKSSRADRVSLDIIDQLGASQIVWEDGTTRALPRDQPTRRVVTLVRTEDGWRIS